MTTPLTEEEFFSIWQSQTSAAPAEPEYRLYYDDEGFPLFFSMESIPGNYIVVDRDTYHNGPKHIRVVNGKIVVYQITFAKKLVPSATGVACAVNDVCVVVAQDQPHQAWCLKRQELENETN